MHVETSAIDDNCDSDILYINHINVTEPLCQKYIRG